MDPTGPERKAAARFSSERPFGVACYAGIAPRARGAASVRLPSS
jgi:hypothetical protein